MLVKRPRRRSIIKPRSEAETLALINGGLRTDEEKDPERMRKQTIRIKQGLLDQIENLAKSRRIKISQQQWLLEAILEKIDREGNSAE